MEVTSYSLLYRPTSPFFTVCRRTCRLSKIKCEHSRSLHPISVMLQSTKAKYTFKNHTQLRWVVSASPNFIYAPICRPFQNPQTILHGNLKPTFVSLTLCLLRWYWKKQYLLLVNALRYLLLLQVSFGANLFLTVMITGKKNKSVEKFTKKTLCVGICVCGNIMTTLPMCGQNVCAVCLNSFTFLCSNLIEQKD